MPPRGRPPPGSKVVVGELRALLSASTSEQSGVVARPSRPPSRAAWNAWGLARSLPPGGGGQGALRLEAAVGEALAGAAVLAAKDLAQLAWAAAQLGAERGAPLLREVAAAALADERRLALFAPRDLAGAAWALARCQLANRPLLEAVSQAAVARAQEFNAQDLANTSWALAALPFRDLPALAALACRSVHIVDDFKQQELASTVWAFATLALPEEHGIVELLGAAAGRVAASADEMEGRSLAGVLWAFATLAPTGAGRPPTPPPLEAPLRSMLAAVPPRALELLPGLKPQDVAGIAWSTVTLSLRDAPLLAGLADVALQRVGDFQASEVDMMVWALSRAACASPLLLLDAHRLYWQAEAIGRGGALALAALLAAAEADGHTREQAQLLWHHALARRDAAGAAGSDASAAAAVNLCAARLAQGGDATAAVAVLGLAKKLGFQTGVSVRVAVALGMRSAIGGRAKVATAEGLEWLAALEENGRSRDPPAMAPLGVAPPVRTTAPSKPALLLPYVLARALAGDAGAAIGEVEHFAEEVLRPRRQWLKVAGGAKKEVLRRALRGAPEGAILEIGTYVGYSTIAFATAEPQRRVVSLEVQPEHALVAQNLAMHAGCAHQIDVWTGHSSDVLARLPALYEAVGGLRVAVVFMDQCGSRFWEDLCAMSSLGLLTPGAVIVADNVLKPGAPLFLWHLFFGGAFTAEVFSVEEFGMPGVEDWVAVAQLRPWVQASAARRLASAAPPSLVQELEWRAREVRGLAAERAAGLSFDDWAAFSARMRTDLAQLGIAPGGRGCPGEEAHYESGKWVH